MINLEKLTKRLPTLKEWLRSKGAEVLEPTNEWEVLRFRADYVTHVVYRNAKDALTINMRTRHIIDCFLGGKAWSAGVGVQRIRYTTDYRALFKRDGECCFLCRLPLGHDATVEHLVPVVHGGPNHLANKALAHAECNSKLGHLSAMEKIRMREAISPLPPVQIVVKAEKPAPVARPKYSKTLRNCHNWFYYEPEVDQTSIPAGRS